MTVKNAERAKADAQEVHEGNTIPGRQKESVYTLEEFVGNAEKVFNASSECVFAALKQAGITECTKAKAMEIVKAFRGRKV